MPTVSVYIYIYVYVLFLLLLLLFFSSSSLFFPAKHYKYKTIKPTIIYKKSLSVQFHGIEFEYNMYKNRLGRADDYLVIICIYVNLHLIYVQHASR